VPSVISTAVVQAAEQTAHSSAVRAGGRVITSIAVGAIARFVEFEEVNSFAHARNEAAFLVLPLVCAFTDRACPESSATAGDHE
jgi:hypothetical protein